MRLLALIAAALVAAGSSDVDESAFRYTRDLGAASSAPVRFDPDAAMYGHARSGFPDLRILDADGTQVPWRPEPTAAPVAPQAVALVARGSRGGTVSVVLDREVLRPVVDRVELDVPDRTFVGSVDVLGSQTGAEGSYATLSRTTIYRLRGAVSAESTSAVFPLTDYRFLLVRAHGVSAITGARVARDPARAALTPVPSTSQQQQEARATIVLLDLGFPRVPVDEVLVGSSTPRYKRLVRIEGSDDDSTFAPLAESDIARFGAVDLSRVPVRAQQRYLRVTIENGDDPPLAALGVVPEATSRALLLAGGFRPPFRLLYGAADVPAPEYDFAKLPAAATGVARAVSGTLGAETTNAGFEEPADTRTFFERHDWLIQVLLVAGALVAAVGGIVALGRRR